MLKKPRNRSARVSIQSVPPPIGGLNTLDSIADMQATDALILDNYFPGPGGVPLRNGFEIWASGIAGNVETLAVYDNGVTQKMFAVSGGSLYDVTSQAAVGAPILTGLSNSRWQWANFGNVGNQFLWMCNGVDYPLIFDGTTWHTVRTAAAQTISSLTAVGTLATMTTGAPHGLVNGDQITVSGATPAAYNGTFTITSTGANTLTYVMASAPGGSATVEGTYAVLWSITGVDPRTFVHVVGFQSRLWLTTVDSFTPYYLGLSAVSGAASPFNVAPQMSLGGYLMGCAAWSVDNAAGLNEYLVFVSSNGEVVVYVGYDPTLASAFSLAAKFKIGSPLGRRFFEKVGSDLFFATTDGLTPLSKAMLTDRSQPQSEDTIKIQPSVNADALTYGGNFGWQPILFPAGNKLMLNVPLAEDASARQYVQNTMTNAWCRFTGWNANAFVVFMDKLYFAGAGIVALADVNADDNGQAINGDFMPAFSYFQTRGRKKRFQMVRPIILANSAVQLALDLSVDFLTVIPTSSPGFSTSDSAPWDEILWDTTPWGDAQNIIKDWITVDGEGFAATVRMRSATIGVSFSIQAIDWMVEPAAIGFLG